MSHDYDWIDMEDDYNDDPEIEDAANNHGQPPAACSEYYANITPKENINTMHNNVKLISRPQRGLSATSLNIGEYARVVGLPGDTGYGDIVLKTRIGIVNLSNPNLAWDSPFSAPLVERLNTGDKLEITVGFTADFEKRVLEIGKGPLGNKINAIKYVREASNMGLKEAKDYVEGLLSRDDLKF